MSIIRDIVNDNMEHFDGHTTTPIFCHKNGVDVGIVEPQSNTPDVK